MAASPAGPGGPGDWGAEGLPVVVWPCDGGLLLQDMRSFGRATGPDLSLGLQSPPPHPCPACLFGTVLAHGGDSAPSIQWGAPLAPLSHSPGVATSSMVGGVDS